MTGHVHYAEEGPSASLSSLTLIRSHTNRSTGTFSPPDSETTTINLDVDLSLVRSISHDDHHGDLSRPTHAFTDEARGVSKTGLVKFVSALTPVHESLPDLFKDPEKAQDYRKLYLVTWLENDPEDPRNWSKAWRWCMSTMLLSYTVTH